MMNKLLRQAYMPVLASIALVALVAVMPLSCAKEPAAYLPDGYRSWNKPVAEPITYAVPGHEDRYRVIYMNEIAWKAKREGALDFPKGSLIVKDMYAGHSIEPGELPVMATFMYKDPGNPLAVKGWVWGMKDLSSGKENITTYDFCVACHAGANEAHPYGDRNPGQLFRDYVYLPPGLEQAGEPGMPAYGADY